MERNLAARLGRAVTPLGYGAWGLGGSFGRVERSSGIRSVLAYLEAGGNLIDTARDYGASEEIVGAALAAWEGELPVVATKVQSYGPRSRWGRPEPVDTVFPPGCVRASVEESLRNLGLERVDLVQLHLYWPTWGTDGYWLDELRTLQAEERTCAIGVSLPDYRHDVGLPLVLVDGVDSVQTVVNVFDPLALDCLVPLAAERGIALLARGVLDEGGLAGAIRPEATFEAEDIRRAFFAHAPLDEYARRVDALRSYVPEWADSLASLALRFVAGQPGVTAAVVSMHEERHVAANVRALSEPPLPAEILEQLGTRHRWVRNFFEPLYWQE